jgi:hypothetical protein
LSLVDSLTVTRIRRRQLAPGQLSLGLVDDPVAIRDVLVAQLRDDERVGRLVPEMALCQGAARIDLAAIGVELDGYEIKSDRDDLRRLPVQAATYGRVFDRLTLVASDRHLTSAAAQIPEWWGLSVINADARRIERLREASPNPSFDPFAVVRLLWRDEAAAALQVRLGRVPRSPRRLLCQQLAEMTSPDELREIVRCALRDRTDWRVAG